MTWKPGFTPEENAEWYAQAARLKEPEQVPVMLLTCNDFASAQYNITEYECYADVKKMYEAQEHAYNKFYKLLAFYPDFGPATLPASLGAKIIWPKDECPWVLPLLKKQDDVDKLEMPDFHFASLSGQTLAYMKYFQSRGRTIPYMIVNGPVDNSGLLRGISQFMTDVYENPDLAHKLLKFCTEAAIEHLRVMEEVVGKVPIVIGDDTTGYLAPDKFKKFALPYIQEIFIKFERPLNLLHSDSNQMHNLELIAQTGAKIWHMGPSDQMDIGEVKRRIGKKICLMGNLYPRLLAEGTSRTVEKGCKEIIEKAALGGGFVLSTGGVIPKRSRRENINAMIRATEKYGKY